MTKSESLFTLVSGLTELELQDFSEKLVEFLQKERLTHIMTNTLNVRDEIEDLERDLERARDDHDKEENRANDLDSENDDLKDRIKDVKSRLLKFMTNEQGDDSIKKILEDL